MILLGIVQQMIETGDAAMTDTAHATNTLSPRLRVERSAPPRFAAEGRGLAG
jgi:hypothetical protein